ncbi:MAG: tyrosine-protein phosphatase [Oligosphaeraceae bacterium]
MPLHRNPFLTFFLLLCLLFGAVEASAALKLVSPENRATVSLLTDLQRLSERLPLDQLEALWQDRVFVGRLQAKPGASLPQGLRLSWQSTAPQEDLAGYRVLVCRGEKWEASSCAVYEIPAEAGRQKGEAILQNLCPGETYGWRVQALDGQGSVLEESPVRNFTVESGVPRILYWKHRGNLREFGGMPAGGGRVLPHGMIYRSTAYLPEGGEPREFGECPVIGETPRLRTVVDLRWEGEHPALAQDLDPQKVQYFSIPSQMYVGIFTVNGMENYRQLFPLFAKRENYPILFHCVVGADRTGTLAMMLQAILGCPEEIIRRDYVLTSFYSTRYFSAVDTTLKRLEDFAPVPDAPLQWKAEAFLLRCGVKAQEIRAFQTLMLGEDFPLSPVLKDAIAREEFIGSFTPAASVTFEAPASRGRSMMQCGKEYLFQGGVEQYLAPEFAGVNEAGEFLFRFQNAYPRPAVGGFQGEGLTAPAYQLSEPVQKQVLLSPAGKNAWTREELAAGLQIPPREECLRLLKPVAGVEEPLPPEYQVVPWEEKDGDYLVAHTREEKPVVDGDLNKPFWQGLPAVMLCQIDGNPADTGRVSLRVATNPAHDVLYLGVEFLEDNTPVSRQRGRDEAVWEDDEVEFFLAGGGHAAYYQLIINRAGCILDGQGTNAKWNLTEYAASVKETGAGWSVEVELPLAQLDLQGPLELNVCTTDFPTGTHRNLGATNGIFHSREAFLPIFLK